MILTWYPDFCPPGQSCAIKIEPDWGKAKRGSIYCSHHQRLMDGGLTFDEVFTAILQSSRAKEAARWAMKLELGLDKEHPGLPYTVDANGDITIQSGVVGTAHARVKGRADAAVSALHRPAGTSMVKVV
jgi:hypothetical protein